MRNSSAPLLFPEIKVPLLRALQLVRPHFSKIRIAWRKKLGIAGLSTDEIEALAPLALEAHYEHLTSANFEAYRQDLERHAHVLQGNGLVGAQPVIALGLYLECCLPYLLAAGPKGNDPIMALTRLVASAESVILWSYADFRAASIRRLLERERQNFSRDLHDDVGHNLLVLKLYLELMTMDFKKGNVAELESKLEEALALVSYGLDSVRRLMLDLGPAMLSQFGFRHALQIYARQFALRTGIQIQMDAAALPENLPAGYETALYRVLQGALSNALQHSHSKHVKLNIGTTKRSLVMSIEDDGTGFDIKSVLPQRAFGITAMRERIETLGGKFHIESHMARPGSRHHGTRIEIDLALQGDEKKVDG
jgi:signal transduction histidine kinase